MNPQAVNDFLNIFHDAFKAATDPFCTPSAATM
jgi:hypothetical protein